jgi:hypothetical protein
MFKKSIYLVLSVFLCSNFQVSGQAFIKPVTNPWSTDCYVTLNDGEEFRCELRSAVFTGGSVRSLSIIREDGTKQKYRAEDVKRMLIKFGDLAKIETIMESTTSIQELLDLNFNEIVEREYIIYEQALLPKKKDKYALLQLLNPGFDNRIKVYENPTGQESGTMTVGDVTVTGGRETSFLVVKDGEKSVKVKKGSYKKSFPILFGDCEEIMKIYGLGKVKFYDMAHHVLYYDIICK